jgi:hypothetical protein
MDLVGLLGLFFGLWVGFGVVLGLLEGIGVSFIGYGLLEFFDTLRHCVIVMIYN